MDSVGEGEGGKKKKKKEVSVDLVVLGKSIVDKENQKIKRSWVYTLLYLKWVIKKDLLYNTENSAQYYITT